MFPAELDPNRHLPRRGCDIRLVAGPVDQVSYVIVDASRAICGRYEPGTDRPYDSLDLREDRGAIAQLLEHFDTAWGRSALVDVLFLPPDSGGPRIHIPTSVDIVGWTPRLAALSANPDELFRLAPRAFEELVAELLNRDGFETTLTPCSRDGGRDVLAARLLPTGPMLCLVECKRYAKERPVSIQYVRGLFGTVVSERASNGLLVTTSSFTGPARAFAAQHQYRMALKEYTDLLAWLKRTVVT